MLLCVEAFILFFPAYTPSLVGQLLYVFGLDFEIGNPFEDGRV